jgi:hypothetical protein
MMFGSPYEKTQQEFFNEYQEVYRKIWHQDPRERETAIHSPSPPPASAPWAPAPDAARVHALETELALAHHRIEGLVDAVRHLKQEVQRLRLTHQLVESLSHPHAGATLTDSMLKELIALAHPDKWPDNPLAHEITVRLNTMRELTK